MEHRFYAPDLTPGDETVALDDDEALHLVRVLRIEPGRQVRVFNGRGLECRARVELADKRGVVLRVLEPLPVRGELPFPLTLAQAVLKADGMEEVARNAVLLGVTEIVPLLTARTEASAAQLERGRRVERWRRVAISSAKQCGRAVVPVVSEPIAFDEFTPVRHAQQVMLVEPEARYPAERVGALEPPSASGAVVLIGPEGGWAAEEIERARASGARMVTLGGLTLRADIAATVALPVLRYVWGQL